MTSMMTIETGARTTKVLITAPKVFISAPVIVPDGIVE
jgi:hypothetical protein